jgi:regulator of protease activity HflC (stomatin/prohibitin superfamily)
VFERLVDLITEFAQLFQVFLFVDQTDEAVVLRAGVYNRTIGPGFHWIWPIWEDYIDVNVKPEPLYCDPQSLHTKDQYLVNIQIGYTYRVTCPKTFLLDYEDSEGAIAMLISGCVTTAVHRTKWNDLRRGVWLRSLKTNANRIANKRGAEVEEIIVQDLANGSANRLWIEGVEL